MGIIKDNLRSIARLLAIVFRVTPKLPVIVLLFTFLSSAQPFVNIIFLQLILDGLLNRIEVNNLLIYAAFAILLNGLIMLLCGILSRKRKHAEAEFELLFQKELNFHKTKLPFSDIESAQLNELLRSIEQTKMRDGGLEATVPAMESVLRNIFDLILAFFSFIRIFRMHQGVSDKSIWNGMWPLLLLLVLALLQVAILARFQVKQNEKVVTLSNQVNQANGGAFLYMQLISDYHFGKDIRIYNLKSFLCKEFSRLWSSSIGYKLSIKLGRSNAVVPCLASLSNGGLEICIYFIAVMKAMVGGLTAGSVILYVESIKIFSQAIMGLLVSFGKLMGYGELLAAYPRLLAMKEEALDDGLPIPEGPYEISFENVSFTYPGSKKQSLKNVNFVLQPGKRVALVGENGSGKSTAIKLLCRLYEPQEGRITLNGKDIKEYNLNQYRQLLSIVFQDFSLFPLKLSENVACSQQYSRNSVSTALAASGFASPQEKSTYLEERCIYRDYDANGIEVSGGEAQKIALSRAIYKDAPFMILDEPTAALDPQAEAKIYESFDKIIADKTAIYVSHRLSSCLFCHDILVFEKGQIVQQGTHENLSAQSGKYKVLWEAQAQLYTSA